MAKELTVPTLGMDMTEATIVRWLVSEGETVEKGDPVLEIDTDKTSFEVEAPDSGTISGLSGDEGETLAVGTRVAYILAPGEDAPDEDAPGEDTPEPSPGAAVEQDSLQAEAQQAGSPEPEAPKPMEEPGTSSATSSSASPSESHSANGVASSTVSNGRGLRASPAARRLAVERGIELSEITGSGPNGRVYLSDVANFEAALEETPEVEPETGGTGGPAAFPEAAIISGSGSAEALEAVAEAGTRRESLTQVRRIGAERTQRSFSEVPHFYLRRDMDAEGLVALRERLKEKRDPPAPSLNDLVAFAVSRTLPDHPRLNARYDDGELVMHESVNLGIAAATERGLLVPVVRGADTLRLSELAGTTGELLTKARDGKLSRDELTGGTFTISNLGMMGVDSFDAIINQPEAAILAVGSMRTTPLWDGGDTWVPRKTISVTLSVDHRVADGADGARFLSDLQDGLSNWELLI